MRIIEQTAMKEDIFFQESQFSFDEKVFYIKVKRIFDILGSLFGLFLLFPLLIIVAILIKFDDPNGNVIFKQKRIGKNGKTFYMLKFRSMVSNAEEKLESILDQNETTGAMFKIKNDPRVTKIGRLIRKTSVDELPQLWNVFKGEMSLVGPRPPLPREYKLYNDYHKQRLLVTPGCTGLWQVSGRSLLGFEEMVILDLSYIKNRSLLFDLKIIFKTLKIFKGSEDAY